MSSQSADYPDHSTRIMALESVVAKISTSVSNNDESLKQVLEGQNFMARLLMRCLNSEAGSSSPLEIPSSLQGLFNSPAVGPGLSADGVLDSGILTPEAEVHVTAPESMILPETAPTNSSVRERGVSPPVSPRLPQGIARAPDAEQGSWMSGSTVLITPSMGLENPNFPRRRSASAVSTDVSDSIQTPSLGSNPCQPILDIYFGPEKNWRSSSREEERVGRNISIEPERTPASPTSNRVHTRQQSNADVPQERRTARNEERLRCGNLMLPRLSDDPIACNKPCFILHPDFPDAVVAEGKSGGSWKAKTQKLGHLCNKGEQMVQVHKVSQTGCRLLHVEERQSFRILDDAVVKKTGSAIYVKWDTRYLVRNLHVS